MAKRKPLSVSDYDAIRQHNDVLIASARDEIAQLKKLRPTVEHEYLSGQLLYWEHVYRALRWSNAVAAQRARVEYYA